MYIKVSYTINQPIIKVTTSDSQIYVKVVSPSPIYVKVGDSASGGSYISRLDQLEDVSATSASNGDVLQYVSSTGLWTKTSSINFGTW
jgi:hypothetical protein